MTFQKQDPEGSGAPSISSWSRRAAEASYLTTPPHQRTGRAATVEAVLCDLDDTLYPQAAWLEGAWRAVAAAAAQHGIHEPAFLAALQAEAALGSARSGIIDRALAAVGVGAGVDAGADKDAVRLADLAAGSSAAAASSTRDVGGGEPGRARSGRADSGRAEPGRAESGSAEPGSARSGRTDSGCAEPGCAESGSAEPGSARSGRAESGSADSGRPESDSAESGSAGSGRTDSGRTESSRAEPGGTAPELADSDRTASGHTESAATRAVLHISLLNPAPSQPAITAMHNPGRAAPSPAQATSSPGHATPSLAQVAPVAPVADPTPSPSPDPTLLPQLIATFRAHRPTRLEPYPGVREALTRLRAAGVRLAVVTDGDVDMQAWKVRALGLSAFFECVVVSDALGGRAVRKPHATPFLAALEGLGVAADRCVVVGDRPEKDVTGAAGVDIRAVRVKTGEYRQVPDVVGTWHSAADFAGAVDWLLGA